MDSTEEKMIRLSGLTVGYGARRLISGVDASFSAGRLIALVGRNGAGKSSLLRVLGGIDRPLAGAVEVEEKNVMRLSPQEKARLLSFVTTERTRIADLRCRDLVALGRAPYTGWMGRLSPADKEIVEKSLRLVGMEGYAARTMDSMSDGECQRVMIARALAQDTPVMLLDEPTSFLDLPNRYDLCLLLRDLAHSQRKCIIFSTHELDIALQLADDIALIDTPRLAVLPSADMACSGHIERLFSNPAIRFDPLSGRVSLTKSTFR